jgi:hypothetical protein
MLKTNPYMRIYLAGRVTGLNYRTVRKRFARAEAYLISIGFEVVNPLRIVPEGCTWTDSMRICIHYLSLCNYIALLPGWEKSRGASIEYEVAIGMEEEGKLSGIIHLQEPVAIKEVPAWEEGILIREIIVEP